MKKTLLFITIFSGLIGACNDPNPSSGADIFGVLSAPNTDPVGLHPDDKLGTFGAAPPADAAEPKPYALPAAALLAYNSATVTTSPSSMIITGLPKVGMQGTTDHLGSPGSCEAWAFGYGLGSYTASRNPSGVQLFDPTLPTNAVSTAFLYISQLDSISGTCPTGTAANWYLEKLVTVGAPSSSHVPYRACCSCLEKIDLSAPIASRFQIGSFARLQLSDSPDSITRMKAYIANSQPIAFSGLVLEDYGTALVVQNGVMTNSTTIAGSGHAQMIVGYDDTIGDPTSPGAFLVQNSFGTDWPCNALPTGTVCPNPGMIWWPYETWQKTQGFAAIAFPITPGGTTGLSLLTAASTNPSGAPSAAISKVWQWTPEAGTQTSLVLWHEFSAPVLVNSITLTEPSNGSSVTVPYDEYLRSGYIYVARNDSNQFLSGSWQFSITATTVAGVALSYSGSVIIPATAPNTGVTPLSISGVTLTAPGGETVTPVTP